MARREEMHVKYGIEMFEHESRGCTASFIRTSPNDGSLVVLAVKPQRLHRVLEELKGSLVKEQLVVSIVAGAKIETIAEELLHASIVRTMPNTPAQIGEGVTAWTASADSQLRNKSIRFARCSKHSEKLFASRTNDRSIWRQR